MSLTASSNTACVGVARSIQWLHYRFTTQKSGFDSWHRHKFYSPKHPAYSAFYTMDPRCSVSSMVRRSEREADHSTPSRAKVTISTETQSLPCKSSRCSEGKIILFCYAESYLFLKIAWKKKKDRFGTVRTMKAYTGSESYTGHLARWTWSNQSANDGLGLR